MENIRLQLLKRFEEEGPVTKRALGDLERALKKTFYLQRKDINSEPAIAISTLEERWPYLFRPSVWLLVHFRLLTDIPATIQLSQALDREAAPLEDFFLSLNPNSKVGKRISNTKQAIQNSLVDDGQRSDPGWKAAELTLLLLAYFDEPQDALFHLADVSTS